MVRRWLRSLPLALAALASLAATPGSAQELRKINLGITSASIPASVARVAKELGLWEKQGLDVTIKTLDNGQVASMGLVAGSLDFTTTAPSDVVMLQSRGQDIVALTGVYRGFAGVLVISKAAAAKSGLTAASPLNERLKAVNGLTIATPSATSTYTFTVKSAIEAAGAKVNFTYMAQQAMVAAFETGAIQGFIAGAPFYSMPALSGSGVIWVSGPKGEFPPQYTPSHALTLNAKRDFAKANPDLVKKAVAVFAEVSRITAERPGDVKAAIGKLFPDVLPANLDLIFEQEAAGFRTTTLTVEDIAREIAYVKGSGGDVPPLDGLKPADLIQR